MQPRSLPHPTKLFFYGGINEIGGNKILLKDKDLRVFLDFGKSFNASSLYFEEFINPRTSNGIVDYLEMGILPNVSGIYRNDLLKFAGLKQHESPEVDAVVLTHAHLDHSCHVSFLDESIPIYCNNITHAILESVRETHDRDMEQEILDFKRRPILNPREEPVKRKFELVEGKFKVKGQLEVEMIPVDHSVPGATALAVYASDQTIVYSGDIRLHGTHGELTNHFVEKLGDIKPDIFLCEGTRIEETDRRTESDVAQDSEKMIKETGNLVVADFSYKDVTRLMTFYDVAKRTGRRLAIQFDLAHYIEKLSPLVPNLPSISDDNILLYQKKKDRGLYREQDYRNWEKEYLGLPNVIRATEVRKHQNELIACLGYYDIPDLIDIMPLPGSAYIKSASEVNNEEDVFDVKRLQAWLDHFHMRKENYHASGHAPQPDLAHVMNESNSKAIVPIHTERPDLFNTLVESIPITPATLSSCQPFVH